MPSTSRTTSRLTSRSTTRSTSNQTTTTFSTSQSTTTTYTTTFQTSRATSRTTTYNSYFNTSHVTTYTTSWAVSTSRQTSNSTTSAFNTTYYTTLSRNTTIYTNTNTIVNTPVTTFPVSTSAPVYRSTTFYRPPKVEEANLMLNLDARVSAGNSAWKDQSGNSRDATVSGTMGISDRCVALYNFHSDATDLTGNYTGTESNITYASGNYGQAAVFNGSSSKITTSYTANDSAFTISGWIKHTSATFVGKYPYLAGKGYYSNSSSNNYWQLVNYSSEFPEFRIRNGGASVAATSSVAMNLNQWHHLVGTVDSSGNMKIYLDGALTGSATGAPSRTMTHGINYGVYLDGTTYFHEGQIDQIRVFNRVITSEEVTSLYNENSSTFKKVDIFNDAVAGYYTLDSTDNFYTSQFITDQNFTIGGWFYRNSSGGSSGYESLWAQGYAPSVRCSIYGADGSANGNRLYIYLHNGSTDASYNTNIDLPTAEWFHLMKTYDMSTGSVKVYLNGALKLTQSTITGNIYSASNSDPYFRIAKNSTNANGYINGRISQVRVYDSVLTDEQVLDDYTTHDYLYT